MASPVTGLPLQRGSPPHSSAAPGAAVPPLPPVSRAELDQQVPASKLAALGAVLGGGRQTGAGHNRSYPGSDGASSFVPLSAPSYLLRQQAGAQSTARDITLGCGWSLPL